jgi:uncharacterized damage-inducible protein DinB
MNQNIIINMKHFLLILIFALGLIVESKAQNKELAFNSWKRAKAYTLEFLEAMPAESYGYKPTPETRSFAEHFLHLSNGHFNFANACSIIPSPVTRGAANNLPDKSKVNTMEMVLKSYDYVLEVLNKMTDTQFNESINFVNQKMPRAEVLNKAFEHQTHHRGQTAVYLRLQGITPPKEKLFD